MIPLLLSIFFADVPEPPLAALDHECWEIRQEASRQLTTMNAKTVFIAAFTPNLSAEQRLRIEDIVAWRMLEMVQSVSPEVRGRIREFVEGQKDRDPGLPFWAVPPESLPGPSQ